jgi:replicative DNA helicase
MAELAEAGVDIIGTPTGFRDLDRITSGLEPGNLAILAARPGMGKSALAHGIAAHIGIRLELPVAVFSLEMSKAELSQRFLAREAHVDLKKIRSPGRSLQQDEWARLTRAGDIISKAPIYMNDRGGLSLLELRSELRRLKTRLPTLGLAIVDYLQLMEATAENRTQEITKISKGLKVIARDLDVPILALSQLNRAVEQRVDKRPQLSDLRESGSIEQDADLVMFLYRDGYYNEDAAEPNVCDLILAKHRNGPVGKTELSWVPAEASFTDLHRPGVFT